MNLSLIGKTLEILRDPLEREVSLNSLKTARSLSPISDQSILIQQYVNFPATLLELIFFQVIIAE